MATMGSHIGYPNIPILTILNCDVAIKGEGNILPPPPPPPPQKKKKKKKKISILFFLSFTSHHYTSSVTMAQETIFSIFQIMKLLMKIKICLYYVGYQNGTILKKKF